MNSKGNHGPFSANVPGGILEGITRRILIGICGRITEDIFGKKQKEFLIISLKIPGGTCGGFM